MSTIKYSKVCTAVGRNGISKCVGINVLPSRRIDEDNVPFDIVTLTPLNSQGTLTHGWIEVEMNKVPDLIKELQFYYDYANSTKTTSLQG